MFKSFISLLLALSCYHLIAQDQIKDSLVAQEIDTVTYKTAYGLRLGVDLSKQIKPFLSNAYNSGIEFVADYRVSKNFYIAAEIGYEDHTTVEDYTQSRSDGSFARIGFNFNAYENWLDMNNEIFVGYRFGISSFDQTLENYTPNVNTNYFPGSLIDIPSTTALSTQWSELMVGVKVETLKNLFVSATVSFKILMNTDEPENFKTLYSPGFNRLFETGTGFGFNYTLSYLIPFQKK